jgi:hypothetical protein
MQLRLRIEVAIDRLNRCLQWRTGPNVNGRAASGEKLLPILSATATSFAVVLDFTPNAWTLGRPSRNHIHAA